MTAPLDIIEGDDRAPGRRSRRARKTGPGPRRKFLSIWFRCCHVYGRLYRNASGTAYDGRCPKCGRKARALIGPDGTSQRMFEAR
ncbi:MAG: hypothetical protein SYC29_02360 [Planctomycetota bacterium]|nr:hypothetical protein [Planctomycetota bacterium]